MAKRQLSAGLPASETSPPSYRPGATVYPESSDYEVGHEQESHPFATSTSSSRDTNVNCLDPN